MLGLSVLLTMLNGSRASMGRSFLPLLFLPLRDWPDPLKDTWTELLLPAPDPPLPPPPPPPNVELPSPAPDGVDVPEDETESILLLSILSFDAIVGGGGRGFGAGSTNPLGGAKSTCAGAR